jgi:DNA-binding transcriptional LysR family regulator
VSKRIKALEEHLGVRLLHRTTRTLSPTWDGQRYYERVSGALEALRQAEEALRSQGEEPTGTLRVCGPMSFGIGYLAPAVAAFMERHRRLEVELELTDRLVDPVAEGFEVVVRLGRLEDSGLVVRRLMPMQRHLCASPAYLESHGVPRLPQELRQHRCLRYSYECTGPVWSLEGTAGQEQVKVEGPMLSNNGESLVHAALRGLGVAYLPGFFVQEHLASGALVELLPHWTDVPSGVWALYPHRRHLSARVRLFVDFLVERFSGSDPQGSGRR